MPFSLRSLFASLSETRTARRRAVETGVNVEPMETRALLSATAFGFVAGFDGGAVENAQDVATDSTGAVYSVGSFAGTTDFDPGPGSFPLTAQGPSAETDAFISKLDSEGNFVNRAGRHAVVLRQDPAPGTAAEVGTTVNIVLEVQG